MNVNSSLVDQSNYGFSLFCLDLDSDLADGTIFVIRNNTGGVLHQRSPAILIIS